MRGFPPKIGQIFGFPPLERVTLWVPPLNPSQAPQNLSPPSETGACPRMPPYDEYLPFGNKMLFHETDTNMCDKNSSLCKMLVYANFERLDNFY